jgi:hypothetical protein
MGSFTGFVLERLLFRIGNTNIIDAAVYWKRDGYIPDTFHVFKSFQYRKHLNLGRGGMILTDDSDAATQLKENELRWSCA